MITIKTSDTDEAINIPEDRLRKSSPVFREALDKRWKDAVLTPIEMLEDSADIVAAYANWLKGEGVSLYKNNHGQANFVKLARLYVFGEKVQDDAFRNEVIDAFTEGMDCKDVEGYRGYPEGKVINIIYAGTPEDSPARRLMIDVYLDHGIPEWFQPHEKNEFRREFLFDLTRALLIQRQRANNRHSS